MIILNTVDIEHFMNAGSRGDVWRSGRNAETFNQATRRIVDMSSANDRKPGVLGYTR